MDAWRGLVLICSLLVGCGGSQGPSGQEDERPQDGLPSDDTGNGPAGGSEEPPPDETRREPPPTDPTETPPSEPAGLGTATLVKDLFPPFDATPRLGPGPESLVALGSTLYFAANFEDGNGGLWKSDGTAAGTVPVKEFPAGGEFEQRTVKDLTLLGSQLFFTANDAAHGRELWVSDGTPAGTRLVKDLVPGAEDSSPYRLTPLGQTLLFFQYVPEQGSTPGHTVLWRTDGTGAGTRTVRDLGSESAVNASQARVGGTLFFVVSDAAHGTELWKTDGTEAGTGLVRDLAPGAASAYPSQLQTVGGRVFFLASTSTFGSQLWRTDGTAAGTQLVRELSLGPDGGIPYLPGVVGNRLYLALAEPSDLQMSLYALEVDGAGEVEQTRVATLPNPYSDEPDALPTLGSVAVTGGKLFFALTITSAGPAPRDVQLWVTDGTEDGTVQLARPLSLSDEFSTQLSVLGNQVLFSAISQGTGLEPWVTDGTAAGTRRLQDIAPGADSSYPHGFTRVGSKVFFVAYDPRHGSELWVFPPAS